MTYMQRRRIDKIRAHFELRFDEAFEKMYTMSRIGNSTPEQMDVALQLSFAQGVLKAIDLLLGELGET